MGDLEGKREWAQAGELEREREGGKGGGQGRLKWEWEGERAGCVSGGGKAPASSPAPCTAGPQAVVPGLRRAAFSPFLKIRKLAQK